MAINVTLSEARALWRDAPADDNVLELYLDAAEFAVSAYVGGSGDNGSYADYNAAAWTLATVMQARNTWNAGKASPSSGEFGNEGYGISAMPLDWQVKQLLRPQRGVGAIA